MVGILDGLFAAGPLDHILLAYFANALDNSAELVNFGEWVASDDVLADLFHLQVVDYLHVGLVFDVIEREDVADVNNSFDIVVEFDYYPAHVRRYFKNLSRCVAVLIVWVEGNYGITGLVKNTQLD